MSQVILISTLVYLTSAAIDYLSSCNRHTPTCLSYNDGCNDCGCDINTGFSFCTQKACFVKGTPVCKQCEAGYWLSFHTFQAPGYPTCDSRLIMAPTVLQDNSKCACPASNPYYVPGVGCVNENYCTSNIKLRRDIFTFRAPPQIGQCPYEYQLCTSNMDCDGGLICNIPTSNYETCIPLAARFDDNCNLITNCPRCIEDCMGTGYGYCIPDTSTVNTPAPILPIPIIPRPVPPALCETGGCSGQICEHGASGMISTCEWRCEYGCLQFQTCGVDQLGNCGWRTNIGQELEYENCMNSCTGIGTFVPPMLPPTAIQIQPLPMPIQVEPLPNHCAFTSCLNQCGPGIHGNGECYGCSASSVVCTVESCNSSPCCGCAKYSIGNRDVTQQCLGPLPGCICFPGDTYCCDGNQYSSACAATCGTCYDLAIDCTLGPCV